MINSELLKEAIADAKAVRATALANAKASLEEAFAPRFEAMFAEKLKEDSEEEQEEMVSEVEAPNQVSGKGGEAKGPATKAVSKGQPKKVSDAASNFKTVAVGGSEGAAGSKAPAATQSIVKETEEQEEVVAEAGLTSEDLDEIIKELEAEVSGEEEGEPQAAAPAPAPEPDGDEVPAEMPAAPPVDPLAAAGAPPVAPAPVCDPAAAGAVPGAAPVAPAAPVDGAAPAAPAAPEGDEEINLEELLASLNEEAEEEEESVKEGKLPPWLAKKGEKGEKEDKDDDKKEDMDESKSNNGVPTNELKGQDKSGGVKGYPAAPQDASKHQVQGKNHNISGKGNIGTGEVGGKPKMEENKYKVALKEAYDAIRFLRGQINEVNLLNAKLLYTNKLFKEFAGVLDDSYRMKIVESFDLTKSVREVKLAYALLAESLNFGKTINSKPVSTKPQVKKNVTQITEGLASKPVASTKPSPELISENVNEMASRFKKLAGIKEAPKK